MTKTGSARIQNLADQILVRIRSGEYPPGSRLRQEALAEELEVSRTPIREALRILEVRGFVHHVPNQGTVVRVPEPREIQEAYRVRAELEGLAVELATEWITDADIEKLKCANADFIDAVERTSCPSKEFEDTELSSLTGAATTWVDANSAFHDVILRASGNEILRKMISELHVGLLQPVMMATVSIDGRWMRENVAQHKAIIEAIERHDAVEARRQMTHHVKRSGELMVRWLESTSDQRAL